MKQKRFFAVSLVMLASVMAAVGFTVFSLSNTVKELSVEMGRSEADVILTSAEISDRAAVTVPILYYSQEKDACVNLYDTLGDSAGRQFEWAECGYYNSAYETGLTEPDLNEEFLPVAAVGKLLPNRGLDFSRWFSAVPGLSQNYGGTLTLSYLADEASFVYEDEEFYPLEKIVEGGGELFTLNLGVPISVLADGREEFSVTADDDTFVYLGSELVLDMGGVHEPMEGRLKIMENGEVYTAVGKESLAYSGVKVSEGEGAVIRVFHANRNSGESVFKLRFSNMLLNITNSSTLASGEVQVAYDPENPSFVAPLGESLTVKPNVSRAILVSAVTQIALLGALMLLFLLTISLVSRYSRRDRIREE
ncbi:MAG: hypothetical protein Q4B29_00785 [Candidatus Saccharibacteria bacterium]|nr:hypothetical protein [Candidatus Saccharibacteria bacterium]